MNKVQKLKQMHEEILNWDGDEMWYYRWCYLMPDEPTEEDFVDVAQDTELYEDCVAFYENFLKNRD